MRKIFCSLLVGLIWLLSAGWVSLAIWFDGPSHKSIAIALIVGFIILTAAVLLKLKPIWKSFLIYALLFSVVFTWWLSLKPSNSRQWQADVANLPRAEIQGDILTVHNVRDFRYKTETDYEERWETRTYDLNEIVSVDLFMSYWGSPLIAHTILSWGFSDGQRLAISIETRKEVGENYSAVRGFFREYELYYVVADERDVVGVRTNFRGEQVYIYNLKARTQVMRGVLEDYFKEINQLTEEPQWYNALTLNCTTAIRSHIQHVVPTKRWNWRMLANGYLDELMYERGTIDSSLPFPEMKKVSHINSRANSVAADGDFSQAIRVGVPGMQ